MFDYAIADMDSMKKSRPIVTEFFSRVRKLDVLPVITLQSYFKVPKTLRQNETHYVILKTPNTEEFQQIASNHSFNIELKDFMKLCKDYTKKPFSFLVNDITL